MARDTQLTDDLAALAEEERRRLGEPPSIERLLALRDGELAEEEAESLRERLAVDPESAAIYLALEGSAETEDSAETIAAEISDADIETAWQELSPRLDDRDAPAVRPMGEAYEVVPFPDRNWNRVLGVAAALALALGLVWWLAERRSPSLPKGEYHQVSITTEAFRDSSFKVPEGVAGVILQIDAVALDAPGDFVVELLDSSDQVVRRQRTTVEVGQREIELDVARGALEEGRSYRLAVRQAEASPTDIPLIDIVLKPVFEASPKAGGARVPSSRAPISCADFDGLIDAAIELRRAGERQAAEKRYDDLLAKADARGCRIQEARIWNAIATLAILEGRLVDGRDHLKRAKGLLSVSTAGSEEIAVFEEQASELMATIELSQGVAYSRLGWFDEARQAFHRTRTLYRRVGADSGRQAKLLFELARVYRLQGQAQEAREAIRQAQALGRETEGWKLEAALWQESARLEIDGERLSAAERALEEAVEAVERQGDDHARANVYVDVAELRARQGRWAESLRWLNRTLDLSAAAKTQDLNLEAHARHVQSVALQGLGDLDRAKHTADRGLALLEAVRDAWRDQGLQFFARRREHYRHRIDLAASIGDPEDAWKVFEAGRAQSLLESSGVRERRPESDLSSKAPDDMAQARLDVLAAVRQLDNWEPAAGKKARELHQARLQERRLALRALQDAEHRAMGLPPAPSEIDPDEARRWLDSDTLGLVFAAGVDRFHLLILDPRHELEILSLDDRRQIQDMAAGVLESLDPRTEREIREHLDSRVLELSRLLLAPLGERLDGFRRLAIVAEASLSTLPFEVLRHPETGRRLIESHDVAYLPSFSVLGALRRRAGACVPPRSELLAMGDPIFGSEDPRWPAGALDPRNPEEVMAHPSLQGSATEVARIARLYAGAEPITGKAATRERFLAEAPAHRVIHVASHAWSDARIPERSRIALSCVDSGDVVAETCDLYFVDVLNLELCGQTVVLSACKTAGGLAVEGEGILGLPWAFLRAGASTVVASLWQVGDEGTAELMSAFHPHLEDGLEPAMALRQAKRTLIDRGETPSTWAAFVLLGDGWINDSPSTFPARPGPIHRLD